MEGVFAYFDGDNIGNRLEILLLDDRPDEARLYSESVSLALRKARALLDSLPSVSVIIAGGDDLLATWSKGLVTLDDVERVCRIFSQVCGQSMSVGVSLSASGAAVRLRRAKLMGKAQVVAEVGAFDVD